MIIAHRGGIKGSKIKENTLQAFERAMRNSAVDGIECDLRLTAEGVVVIHHDPALADGRSIATLQWNDLPNHVPTLRDLLRRASHRGYQGLLNLEIKTYNTIDKVINILHEFPTIRPLQILISSFLHTEVIQRKEAGFARGIILSCQPHCNFDNLLNTGGQPDKLILRDSAINWNDPTVSLPLVSNAHDVYLWTVNDPIRVRHLRSKGFNVITDVLP